MIRTLFFLLLIASFLGQGCQKSQDEGRNSPSAVSVEEKPEKRNVVLFLGDSLTAGYGLSQEEAYPALIEKSWKKQGLSWQVRNAGVSGYTSGDVLENLSWCLTSDVYLVFLAIGANDGLRGQKISLLESNLLSIIDACQQAGAVVVLAGMKIPPNYGQDYTRDFAMVYSKIASQNRIELLPFLLEGIAGKSEYNLEDGIHPNAKGHRKIATMVEEFFKKKRVLP